MATIQEDLKHIVITGASGFLGGVAATEYSKDPGFKVTATSRRASDNFNDTAADYLRGDLCDNHFCDSLTRGKEYVVHCAALSSPWGRYLDFELANIVATRNLLDASVRNKVKRFVFISTPSIYFNFTDRYNIRETDPLPTRMVNWYAQTKLAAEGDVLARNGIGIETIALRPRAIIGAGDTTIFPRLLTAYSTGKLKVIGDGNVKCDLTCVKNVVHAIRMALCAPATSLGLAYNISDGDPAVLWDMINYTLAQLGHEPVKRKVPYALADGFAGLMEWNYRMFRNNQEPPLTRFGIGVLAKSLTMDISRAKDLLDYHPVQTTLQGVNEFIDWYKNQKA